MRYKGVIAGLTLAVSLILSSCGGAPAATPTTAPEAPPTTSVEGKIAFLLPETKTARYESQDLPNFKAKLTALGFDVDANLIYSNANQDSAVQQQQAEAALTNGAKVLVLDPVDSDSAAVIADLAKSKGVPVIAYDRLIKNSDGVNYYISFDNEKVGQLQGEALLAALAGKTNPTVVFINGSPTDNNAAMFKAGAHKVLDGKVNIAKEYDTPDWSPDKAQEQMTQALTALGNKVDGVLAANDGTAGGSIAAMKAAGLDPLPPITGQDAELAAIQRILAGEQYMTIYKAIKPEAEAAAELAFTLLQGKTPDAALVNGSVNNGKIDVPSILLAPVVVTKDNIKDTVVADGFWTAEQICTADFAEFCAAAGLTGAAPSAPAASGDGKIAFLLPETKTARYESQDLPNFKAKLTELGFDVDANLIYSNANQDSAVQQQQAEAALTNGAKVLVLDPVDSDSAAVIADLAKSKGVPVIAYDRLIKGSDGVNYYISFDNEKVGQLQGEALLAALAGKTNPTVVFINGSPTDNNAAMFKAGAHKVLDGKVTIAKEYDTPDWSPDKAQEQMTQALTALGNKVDGVLAANDGTAGGSIAAMKAAGMNPLPPITGQDAELAAIQRILADEQYMTVYKAIKPEAEAAAELAFTLLNGGTPDAALVNGSVNNGVIDVPSILLAPVVVTKDNIKDTVVADGFWTVEQICIADFAEFCAAAGLTGAASAPAAPVSDVTGKVEVFSWWTGGGEAAGLEAMIKVFNAQYPGVEFVNAAVAGGAGTNARAVLATRLQAGDPPESFQGHAGQELIGTYVAADQLEPLNFLYEENGWLEVMPETLIPLISKDGNIYSVPVNIHRANVMWYNPQVLSANGIEVPVTWDEFFAAAEKLQAAGIIPLALGEQWTSMHLMETVLLGSLGAEKYNGLWDGTTSWNSPEVAAALENYKKVLTFTNSDSASLTWQDAAKLVEEGKAAFNIMGDWADGLFTEDGLTPNEGYAWAPVPGTDGIYQFLSDSFVLSKGAKDRDAAIAWLTVAGSKAGQDAFNPVKGSIPARADTDVSLYNEYLQSAIADWKSDVVVGSLTHGVVANDSWKTEINDALGLFLGTQDVAGFQSALDAACKSSGPCK